MGNRLVTAGEDEGGSANIVSIVHRTGSCSHLQLHSGFRLADRLWATVDFCRSFQTDLWTQEGLKMERLRTSPCVYFIFYRRISVGVVSKPTEVTLETKSEAKSSSSGSLRSKSKRRNRRRTVAYSLFQGFPPGMDYIPQSCICRRCFSIKITLSCPKTHQIVFILSSWTQIWFCMCRLTHIWTKETRFQSHRSSVTNRSLSALVKSLFLFKNTKMHLKVITLQMLEEEKEKVHCGDHRKKGKGDGEVWIPLSWDKETFFTSFDITLKIIQPFTFKSKIL